MAATSITKRVWTTLLGNVGDNPHPLHPMMVHIPFTLYPLSFGADVAAVFLDRFPPITQFLTSRGLYAFSYYTGIGALVATIPAAITGFAELFAISKERSPEARNVAWWHAGLNISAALIALFNTLTKRTTVDFSPYNFNILLSAFGLGGVFYSSYLGGTMVYKYGVGVRRMGEGKKMIADGPNKGVKSEILREE
ncbi:hypothetical protein BC832DRAFT_595245 [Gaertneriomyces semiglobifer]|nr:hypothetical protein BC832DRAFT_595245 [Gaertneriomyces semiglobifer]